MNRTLSQAEIDALLASAAEAAPRERRGSDEVVVYNFRRPDRVSKEQLRSLHLLHDRFAVNVSTSISAFLRTVTEVSIVSAEQFAYSEFLMSLPDPTAFYAIGMHPLDGLGALEMNPAVAFTMIDRLLGGTGLTPPPSRTLTEIEQNVIDSVIKLLLENLGEAWKAITEVEFRIRGRETRPQMLQVTGPNEIVIVLAFELRVAETQGLLHVCIPATAIESVADRFEQGWHRTRRQPTAQEQSWLLANLARVPVPVSALLETRLAARELLELQEGDVLVLEHRAADPLDVHVAAVRRFAGHLTSDGQRVGVLVERVTGETGEQIEGAV